MKEFQLDIIRGIQSISNSFLDKVAQIVTFLGEETIVIIIIGLFYYVFNKEFGKKLAYVVLTSGLVNGVVKNFVKAPRPIGEEGIRSLRTETATGYSFPSGHTQNAAALYSSVVRYSKKKVWPKIIVAVIIVLVALSRLYLGVHYPVDVIVGGVLGVAISIIGMLLYDKVKTNTLFLATAGIMVPFVVIFAIQNNPLFNDFFKMFGMFCGATLAIMFEARYVNFDNKSAWWKRLIRIVVGLALIVGIQQGLKLVFPDVFYCHIIRYFLMAFVGLGLWPYIFKKLHL